MDTSRNNFDAIVYLADTVPFFSDEDWDDLVELLQDEIPFVKRFRAIFFSRKPQAKDLFIESLSRLCDDGDIDVLVRHLNWQHEVIAFLTSQLKSYESSLAKLDDLRVACARLRDQANRLRERNSALIKALRESSISIPKTPQSHEKSKKNKTSSR